MTHFNKPVLSHVDYNRLSKLDSNEPNLYCRMIDGRTMYQYLLFIEPALRRAHPDQVATCAVTGFDGDSAEVAFFCPRYRFSVLEPTKRHRCSDVGMGHDDARIRDRVDSAIRLLYDVGLQYFLDIGLGTVACPDKRTLWIATFTRPYASVCPDAIDLLKHGARLLLSDWINAEELAYTAGQPRQAPSQAELAELFAHAVAHEFHRRLGDTSRGAAERAALDAILDSHGGAEAVIGSLAERPLTGELLAYWLPIWNRAAVIFESPFDTATDLRRPVGAADRE